MRSIPTLILLLTASPAFGLAYPCPSDPGFCYFDAGNDGCFDPPTDTGPINAALEAGTYPNPGPPIPGSIVCPPSVRKLTPVATVRWSTAAGGDILLYGVKIKTPLGVDMVSGGELHFAGRIVSVNKLDLQADGDVSIDGRLASRDDQLFVESINGSITLAKRTNIKARATAWVRTYNGGDIVAGDKCKLKSKDGAPSIISEGDATTTNVFMQGGGGVSIRGDDITMNGRSTMQALRDNDFGHVSINTNTGAGHAQIDWLIASGRGVFLDVGSVELGRPIGGVVKKSKMKSSRGNIFHTGEGPMIFNQVSMTTPKEWLGIRGVRIRTTGTQIDLRDSSVRGGFFTLEVATGGTCDVTGTEWKDLSPTFDCDTVVGP